MTEEIKEYFNYDPETGLITWKKLRGKQKGKVGDIAGSLSDAGYVIVMFDYKKYRAHRLAWFLHYGTEPSNFLDHINGDRKDNRISNLREVTNRENGSNMVVHRKGKLVGTSLKKNGKYRAAMTLQGKHKCLGYHDTELEAHQAYLAARKHHCGY